MKVIGLHLTYFRDKKSYQFSLPFEQILLAVFRAMDRVRQLNKSFADCDITNAGITDKIPKVDPAQRVLRYI